LNDFLPAKPTAEGVQAISEMFEASVNGDQYDPARWANYYKPYGLDTGTQTQATVAPVQTTAEPSVAPVAETVVETPTPTPAPVAEEAPAPAPAAESADQGKKSADDILAMIRNRQS